MEPWSREIKSDASLMLARISGRSMSSVIAATGGGWRAVFVAAGSMNLVAAVMALFVLKPLRNRMRGADDRGGVAVAPAVAA